MKFKNIMAPLLLLGAFLQSCNMKQEVDMIGCNGVVYTVDSAFSKAEAFAVKDGKFVFVGTSEEVLSKYKSKEVIDFADSQVSRRL